MDLESTVTVADTFLSLRLKNRNRKHVKQIILLPQRKKEEFEADGYNFREPYLIHLNPTRHMLHSGTEPMSDGATQPVVLHQHTPKKAQYMLQRIRPEG